MTHIGACSFYSLAQVEAGPSASWRLTVFDSRLIHAISMVIDKNELNFNTKVERD